MKERPILFSGPMVRAILERRKTQTRRAVKVQPPKWARFPQQAGAGWEWTDRDEDSDSLRHWPDYQQPMPCPYGVPGDRLWVRETWRTVYNAITGVAYPVYRADGDAQQVWESPIFMPRCASRLTLEVNGVRVERLQDISEADAVAEGALRFDSRTTFIDDAGIQSIYIPSIGYGIDAYRSLWESINGPGSWAANPWVWVVEFRRLED